VNWSEEGEKCASIYSRVKERQFLRRKAREENFFVVNREKVLGSISWEKSGRHAHKKQLRHYSRFDRRA
jgi:hypothetical protein